ncbi:hypothetical protein Q0M94_17015 (plasmid) [Deinococcus radiomollis]|uniref:hypothetical protein n=1 Tax=Deinococcus radiomollis TaxID=468916 RepID=UPI003891B404
MNRNTSLKRLLLSVLAILGSAFLSISLAAGSKELNGSGPTEYRAYLETGYSGGQTSGIPRKTLLYAYVAAGEKLALGSSGLGLGTASINVKNQSGTTLATFTGNGCGVISTRAQEVAGPAIITAGGYPQCTYTPPSAGIYQIEFIAPNNASNGNPIPNLTTTQWTAAAGDSTIAAWDITVYSGVTAQTGRVYANYFSLNTGTNGKFIKLQAYILTRDGYQYSVTQNLDPYGYIFFANNKGIVDGTNNPTYASAPGTSTAFHSPNVADTATDYTAKIFLFPPSASLPASSGGEWLRPPAPTVAPSPTNLTFAGRDGTTGYAGSSNGYLTGGTFTFTNPGTSNFAYRLTIPLSSNGTSTDRVLLGTATPGTNTVDWDGLDGSTTPQPVPAGTTNYAAFVKLYGGEIHFPLLDVENSNGLVIQRLSLPGTTGTDSDPYQVYWDDRTLPKIGGPTNPIEALNGVSSAGSAHVWGDTTNAGFGNNNTVDTWSFYPSSPATNGSGLIIRSADIQIIKMAVSTGAPRGHPARYTLDVSNLSVTPGPVQVTVTDPLPAWGSSMTWTCSTGCSATSGSGSVNTVVSLTGNVAIRINVSVTTSNTQTAGTVVTNTGSTTRANDAVDPALANNTSSVNLTVRNPVAGVSIVKDQRNVTQGGTFSTANMTVKPADVVQYRLTYTATGDTSFTTFTVRDSLPAQLASTGNATLTCPNGTTATVAPSGQVYSVNAVTPCGTIQPGDTGTLIIPATVR